MIARYTRPAMGRVWSDENRLRLWLDIELAAVDAWAEIGVVPRAEAAELRQRARVDPARMAELEARTGHDVASFVEAVAETAGPVGRWLHFGLTSSDVVDTALSLQLSEAEGLLQAGGRTLLDVLRDQARRHAATPMIGRTHGIHAEPVTLGLKLARWRAELQRGLARLSQAAAGVRVGQLSGPVGTYAGLEPRLEEIVCRRLGLERAADSTQILARDRHAAFVCALAVLAGSLEFCATEVRGLQRTEVRELEEPFRAGQKGSSSMPHKRNPEKCERIAGLARLVRGHATTALQDQPLWHERDISHSSAERVVLPDACIAVDYAVALFTDIVRDLHVYPDAMRANLERTRGLWASGQVLLALVAAGLDRETAYRVVQENAMAVWADLDGRGAPPGPDFRMRLLADPRVPGASRPALEACFDLEHQLRHVPEIMGRLGV